MKGSGAGIEPYTEALRALGTTMVSTALIDVDLPLLLCLTGSVLVAAAGAAAADDDDDEVVVIFVATTGGSRQCGNIVTLNTVLAGFAPSPAT